ICCAALAKTAAARRAGSSASASDGRGSSSDGGWLTVVCYPLALPANDAGVLARRRRLAAQVSVSSGLGEFGSRSARVSVDSGRPGPPIGGWTIRRRAQPPALLAGGIGVGAGLGREAVPFVLRHRLVPVRVLTSGIAAGRVVDLAVSGVHRHRLIQL